MHRDPAISKPPPPPPSANRFEPLPLGANAFAPPVFTAPSTEEEPKRWRKAMPWLLLAGIAGASGLAVWIAMIVNQPASKDDASERAAVSQKVEERASADEPQAEPMAEPTEAIMPVQADLPAATAVVEQAAPEQAAPEQPVAAAAAPAAEASAQAKEEEEDEKDDGRSPAERAAARAKRHAARAAKAAPASSKLPAAPSRADVLAAMTRVQPAVVRCMDGAHGVVTADMKVLSTGRVASANVTGAPAKAGSCIAGAVRKAKFPEFSAASIAVRYPMKL